MDSTFVIQLVLSVLVGGMWVTLVTMAADRFGSKLGGLLAASEATDVVPLAYAVNGLFLMVYTWLLGKGLRIALGASLTLWFLLLGAISCSPTCGTSRYPSRPGSSPSSRR